MVVVVVVVVVVAVVVVVVVVAAVVNIPSHRRPKQRVAYGIRSPIKYATWKILPKIHLASLIIHGSKFLAPKKIASEALRNKRRPKKTQKP